MQMAEIVSHWQSAHNWNDNTMRAHHHIIITCTKGRQLTSLVEASYEKVSLQECGRNSRHLLLRFHCWDMALPFGISEMAWRFKTMMMTTMMKTTTTIAKAKTMREQKRKRWKITKTCDNFEVKYYQSSSKWTVNVEQWHRTLKCIQWLRESET